MKNKTPETPWFPEFLSRLTAYRKAHGHCVVQRLGRTNRTSEKPWLPNFLSHLTAFKRAHGHCAVPHNYVSPDGYKLGSRVGSVQEGQHKVRMTPERIAQLNALGFTWDTKE